LLDFSLHLSIYFYTFFLAFLEEIKNISDSPAQTGDFPERKMSSSRVITAAGWSRTICRENRTGGPAAGWSGLFLTFMRALIDLRGRNALWKTQ